MSSFTPRRNRKVHSNKRSWDDRFRRKLQFINLEERAVPAAPVIDPIGDRTLLTNQSVLQIPIVASDPDGDPVSVAVQATPSADYLLPLRSGRWCRNADRSSSPTIRSIRHWSSA